MLIFPYKVLSDEFEICSEKELKKSKRIYKLLNSNKEALAKRIWFDKGAEELSGKWYGMMYLDSYRAFSVRHILTPSLSNRSNFAIGTGNLFATGTAGVTSVIPKSDLPENILYLLGVLNSKLMSYYAISHSPVFSGAYYKFSSPYLKKLPIRRIDFEDRQDKAKHDRIVVLTALMLDLHKKLRKATTPAATAAVKRQIEATDAEIDQLVYRVYDLSADEVEAVEAHGSAKVPSQFDAEAALEEATADQ